MITIGYQFITVDPVKLRHFLAVLEAGNFARGAKSLGLSQPAVTKSIGSLEGQLGVKLFERGRFGAQPTEFATLLAGHARLIFAEGALARAELAARSRAEQARLAVGASVSLSRTLPAPIAKFRARWPEIVITVEVGLSASLFD